MKKKNEKVLIFIPSFTFGGGEKHGILIARLLKEIGYNVHIWGFKNTSNLATINLENLQQEGFKCHVIKNWVNLNLDFAEQRMWLNKLLQYFFNFFLPLKRFEFDITKDEFDIVIPFTFYPCLLTVLFKKKLKAKLVFWNHLGGNDSAGINYSEYLKNLIKNTNPVFVTNSKGGAEFLKNTFDKEISDIKVINNTYIPEDFELSERKNDNLNTERINLLQIANFFPEKDLDTLLKGMPILKNTNFDCHLYLVGSFLNKNDEINFKRRVSELEITECITYLGPLDREKIYNELIDIIDIGILSSRSEGMPNSLMEMMYWGLPVVASNIIGIYELVGDKYECLFEIGNPDDFADKIREISTDKNKMIEIGHYNKRRIETNFSKEVILPKWLELIENEEDN